MERLLHGRRFRQRPGLAAWWAVVLVGAVLTVVTGRGALGAVTWRRPEVFFWSVVIAAAFCALGATAVLVVAWRADLAELGILGGTLWAVSILPLVHGLTAPGYLYADNSASAISVFVSLPLGAICALPLLSPGGSWAMKVGRSWKIWVSVWGLFAVGTGVFLLVQPRRFPAPQLGDLSSIALGGVSVALFMALSLRQLHLYWIGRSRASLWACFGIALIGIPGLVWVDTHPYSISWWLGHAIDIAGVLLTVVFLLGRPQPEGSVSEVLAPVVARDPLSAFALGLSPVVHAFVAALEQKDRTTRDHVVRVGELAIRSGVRAGLPARRLRNLGIGALLHDIGKLVTPDEILKANRSLSASEFEVIKEHTLAGHSFLLDAPELAGAAPFVRWHHERFDGTGYPDGISGDRLPFEAGIIAVVDAFDAMTNNRQYRRAVDIDEAIAVLYQHAGTQWDRRCVEVVVDEVRRHGVDQHLLWGVGGPSSGDEASGAQVCIDALPDSGRARVLASSPVAPGWSGQTCRSS
jgi:HD-GYP domain-containing protein (c-di-GMP phosphodiesterase class II)